MQKRPNGIHFEACASQEPDFILTDQTALKALNKYI